MWLFWSKQLLPDWLLHFFASSKYWDSTSDLGHLFPTNSRPWYQWLAHERSVLIIFKPLETTEHLALHSANTIIYSFPYCLKEGCEQTVA